MPQIVDVRGTVEVLRLFHLLSCILKLKGRTIFPTRRQATQLLENARSQISQNYYLKRKKKTEKNLRLYRNQTSDEFV